MPERQPGAVAVVAVAAAAIVAATWPLVLRPTELLGHPLGETDNHVWMLWRQLELWAGRGPVANLPEGLPIPYMDVVNLPLALPTAFVDVVLAYNQVVVLNLVVAFCGAWALARELGASPRAALTAGVGCATAPFLGGVTDFGITESLPVGWIGLHAAWLIAWGRTGHLRYAVGAGASLAAFVLAGWYHAVFGLVIEAVLVPWVLVRHGRPLGVFAQGLGAALLVVPRLLAFLEVRSFWEPRWRPPGGEPPALAHAWREIPVAGTDLLNLVLPSLEAVQISKAVYLGWILIVLASIGGRRAALCWAVAVPLWGLALGHWLRVGGHVLGPGPARWLTEAVPDLEGLSHWHRAAGPAVVFLAAGAALGVERLRWRALAWVAPVLVVAESLGLSQTPWPRPMHAVDAPAAYATLDAPGAAVLLPFDNGRREFTDDVPRIYNRWQPVLDRPVSENYEGPDALLAVDGFVAEADRLCGVKPTVPRPWRERAEVPDLDTVDQRRRAHDALVELDVRYVLLHRDRARTPERAERLLTWVLGPPAIVDELAIFELEPGIYPE